MKSIFLGKNIEVTCIDYEREEIGMKICMDKFQQGNDIASTATCCFIRVLKYLVDEGFIQPGTNWKTNFVYYYPIQKL